jgi:hypothetical protein
MAWRSTEMYFSSVWMAWMALFTTCADAVEDVAHIVDIECDAGAALRHGDDDAVGLVR